jgi:hypothetical protein
MGVEPSPLRAVERPDGGQGRPLGARLVFPLVTHHRAHPFTANV